MENEMRKQIDKVKKWKQFLTEGVSQIEDGDIIEMLDDYDLPDDYKHRLSLKNGEKYTLRKNFKAEQEYGKKNWWVVSGNYFIKDSGEFQSTSLTFTKKEMNDVIKISKKVGRINF
jgi:hypothetical protein